MKLVLASNNAKKLIELRALFEGLPLELLSQSEFGVSEAEEPHISFIENALAKARHAAAATGLAAIADDSGLCVDVLGGAPGVASAVYAPAPKTDGDREAQRRAQDEANNTQLLQRMRDVARRRAAFVSTLVAVRHAADPEPLVACGRWVGEILKQPRGQGGFGYDPLMFIASAGTTVAEMDAASKNAISHRAIAAAQMRQLLVQGWGLG